MEDIVFSSIATVFQLGSSEKHCIDISVKVLDNRYFYVVKAIDRKDIWEKIIIVKILDLIKIVLGLIHFLVKVIRIVSRQNKLCII